MILDMSNAMLASTISTHAHITALVSFDALLHACLCISFLCAVQIVYFYIQSVLTVWRAWSSTFMYCAAWFIIGFVQCRRLGQYHA